MFKVVSDSGHTSNILEPVGPNHINHNYTSVNPWVMLDDSSNSTHRFLIFAY